MAQEQPEEFHMKDLFIDVKLEACANGSTFDYLGKKLFSTEFYRENIGFGITNIDIEVNTSLQPLVTITFKDLYGNTIFGTQSKDAAEDGQSIDYSSIFNWPPPKFLFSFKGYLGRATTWVLNLKRTSTSFNSSDGSYDLKCEFVPNQWGFFADLPFLYLLAAKRLRRDALGDNPTSEQLATITSVFDLLKIGKQVEVKTQDTTKEFDDLVKQLGSIKSNMARAMIVSNILEDGEVIDGVVNNRPIKDFIKMELPKLSTLDSALNSSEKIEQRLNNPTELSKLNLYLLLLIKIDGKDGFDRFGVSGKGNYEGFGVDNSDVSSARNQQSELISKNLKFIDDEIKRIVFSTSETKLEKITIGEIFSQTAKDAAYIIGSIIDAGLEGYRGTEGAISDRQNKRDILVSNGDLIGESFPMMINNAGEEVPAIKENLSEIGAEDIGVDDFEMSFVKKFINAISEGIAKDLTKDGDVPGQDDGKLLQRINNIEMTSGNPYKSYYTNIATNILVRGGIVGYMTRSNDPNIPGSYGNIFIDNDGRQQIEEIAVRDSKNITDTMIKNLSSIDKLLLKRFYDFILKFLSTDGKSVINEEGESEITIHSNNIHITANYPVVMSDNPLVKLTFSQLWKELKKPSTLDNAKITENEEYGQQLLIESVSTNELSKIPESKGILNAQHPLSFVDDATFEATRIMNNNLVYTYPNAVLTSGVYWAVVFRGQDNIKAQEANSSPTDIEYKNKDKDVSDLGQNEPLGYVAINSKLDDDGDVLDRVSTLEYYRDMSSVMGKKSVVFDFDAIKNPSLTFYGAAPLDTSPGIEQFLWNNKIASDSIDQQHMINGGIPSKYIDVAGTFGWTVCAHQINGTDRNLVFGLFNSSQEGISQRIYIRKMCEEIKARLKKIEDEENQIIGSVLGKAGENEGAIYKAMHTLYHQWQSLSYSDQKNSNGGLSVNVDEFKDRGKFNVALNLEKKFGTRHYNLIGDEVEIVEREDYENDDIPGLYNIQNEERNKFIEDGTFVYDFPLQRINGIKENEKPVKVRDSIINLEPMYKINGNTTVLNIIQQICTKNNFLFVPIPGNPGYLDVKNIYSPSSVPAYIDVKNFFHVLFTPTPESRAKTSNKGDALALSKNHKEYNTNSFVIKYGDPSNQIISDIQVGTDDNKVTAESIVNLQRLVDNENQNKKVTTDCSMLPVLAGRSYKTSIKMLGNAQVYPMQFFYLENSPLFGGLYQIMKVSHTITPNDFKTSADGIRMRFSSGSGKHGSISPITLDTFRNLGNLLEPLPYVVSKNEVISEGLSSGNVKAANYSDFTTSKFVDGNKGGPVTQIVPLLSTSELQVFDLGVGIRDIWRNRAIVGSKQIYVIDNSAMTDDTLSAYKAMKKAANEDGIKLSVNSGYRDPYNPIIVNGKKIASSQLELRKQNVINKSKATDVNYLKTAGSKEFNVETGRPGGSNHGAGTALDLNCGGAKFKTFNQPIYEWLILNAYKYGFVRTVPGEEWHWDYIPGTPMFSRCPRDNKLWYGLIDTLNIPETKEQINSSNKT